MHPAIAMDHAPRLGMKQSDLALETAPAGWWGWGGGVCSSSWAYKPLVIVALAPSPTTHTPMCVMVNRAWH
jgi:hypothetical protein